MVQPSYETGNYLTELIFNLSYFFILIIFLNIFISRIEFKGEKFRQNYMETKRSITFRYQFKGPYTRNVVTDGVNEYIPKKTLKSKIIRFLFSILIFSLLGAEIGFYAGCRRMIVEISQTFPQFDTAYFYLLYPTRLFGYLVFFVANAIIYPLIIIPFTKWLTELENVPT